jgi:hypothetical protein
VLTGLALIAVSWVLLHRWWISAPAGLAVLVWWWLFLVLVPAAYNQQINNQQQINNRE